MEILTCNKELLPFCCTNDVYCWFEPNLCPYDKLVPVFQLSPTHRSLKGWVKYKGQILHDVNFNPGLALTKSYFS